jgi:hypothetical protein
MVVQTGTSTTGLINVNEDFAARTFNTGGPNGFFVNSITGTIAAAINGDVYAQRMNPSAGGSLFTHVRSITCWYRVISGFTVPATFRQLRLRRFTGTVASGGTSIPTVGRKDTAGAASQADTASGGDVRIASAGALTSPGTPDTLEVGERITLTKFGSVNDETRWTWNFDPSAGRNPLILGAGHSFAVGTTAAWDAGGTWELGLHVEFYEGRKQG